MSAPYILWATLFLGLAFAAHVVRRRQKRHARETRRTWTVTPASEVYDWAAAEAELSDERGRS